MFNVNEYYDGKVKSLAFKNTEGKLTIGVMAPGEYEFGTSTVEYMTVVSGELTVQLANNEEWKSYAPFETFMVAKDTSFKLIVKQETAYKCLYK